MSELLIKIMQMSLTASYVTLAVLFIRLLLKKAPKIFSYLLWAFVLFRLLCPVSLESPFSVVPATSDTAAKSVFNAQLQDQKVLSDTKEGTEGYLTNPSKLIKNVNNKSGTAIAADTFKAGTESVSMIDLLTIFWLAGIMILFVRALYHYIRLKNKLCAATIVKNNVYRTDRIRTPFVLGLIQPKIYIPSDISDREMAYILLHEQKHIHRFDHFVKLFAYVALILHWFNPLVWLAYAQMVKDMEMSCDESVMKQSKEDIRADYSQSLLTLSAKQSGIFPSMAFGDSNVKSRIKNVMNYKKPGFWLITLAVIALITAGICLITSPPGREPELASTSKKGAEYEVGFIDSHPMIANYSYQFGKKDKLPELSDFGYDIRSTDLSEVDLSNEFEKLILSTFDSKTVWPDKLPEDFEPTKVMELYKNPGLKVRSLHEQGVTGKGVGIAIIDQPLLVDHIEYSEQLKYYYANPTLQTQQASMHGPGVASIAVGKTVGVAPEADLYYIAQDFSNAQKDNTPVAESINQILDLNEQLADENRIRVISISWGWDDKGISGNDVLLEAYHRAKEEGVLVITTSIFYREELAFFGLGKVPLSDPDNYNSYTINKYSKDNIRYKISTPMDFRCVASPTGTEDYVVYSNGGLSWSTPYVAGLYALACQVKPDITYEEFWKLASETARSSSGSYEGKKYEANYIVDPVAIIDKLKERM